MKRDTQQILAEILDTAKNGTYKTAIVYKTNINFKLLKGYIEIMQRNGLITVEGRTVKTTELGKQYLKLRSACQGMLSVTA